MEIWLESQYKFFSLFGSHEFSCFTAVEIGLEKVESLLLCFFHLLFRIFLTSQGLDTHRKIWLIIN